MNASLTRSLLVHALLLAGLILSFAISYAPAHAQSNVPSCGTGFHVDAETHLCAPDSEGSLSACPIDTTYDNETGQCQGMPMCTPDPIGPDGMICVPGTSQAPSCPEHYDVEANLCSFVPFAPSCPEGTHVNDDVTSCIDDEVSTPDIPVTDDTEPTVSHAHNFHHPKQGKVLGIETGPDAPTCTPLLTMYLREGKKDNDPAQVKALQTFLNGEMETTLPVDGVFGAATTQAVRDFQLKYWQDVLAPWVPYGLATDHTTSGFVYKLTEWKINSLHCAPATYPVPSLP